MRIQQLNKVKELRLDAEEYRKEQLSDNEIRRYEALWEGEYLDIDTDCEILPVPVLVSDAQRQKAGLLGGEPRVDITTVVPEKVPGARINTEKQNHLIRQLRLMDQLEDAVQDAITLGTGVLLDGFGSEFGIHPDTSLNGFDHTRQNENYERIEYNDNVYENLPWTLRIHPSMFLVPPNTVRIADATCMFIGYIRHIDDVKADEKLIAKHRKAVKADCCYGDKAQRRRGRNTDDEYILLWDYYDLKTNHRVTFNEHYPYALQDEVDEMLIRLDRLPVHIIQFNKPSQLFWATPDFKLLWNLAKEINDIRSMQSKLRHLQVAKGFYDVDKLDALDPEDQERFKKAIDDLTSDEVMAMIGIHGDPNSFMHTFTPNQPYDFKPQLDVAKEEIEQFGLGIGKQQKGQMAAGRHTKYETQVAEGHFDRSMAPRRKIIADIISDVVTNWSKLLFDFQIEPDIVKTTDAMGNPVVVEFTGADIRADYDYKVSIESMRSKSQDERIEEANMILSQCQPFVQMRIINPANLIKQYLSRIGTDWNIESLLMQQGPQGAPPMPFDQFQQGFMPPQGRPPQGMPMMPMRQMIPPPQGKPR